MTALVAPTLVLDDISPTAEDRGRGLRLVLHWAVDQLAPGPVRHRAGEFRPWDDPTWRDPLWWRYNILRHRYLEPLHPDEFVEGGRFTETLAALTGIPSTDTFFDERNRAIREVTGLLRRQLEQPTAAAELRRLALAEVQRLLMARPPALALMGIASIFDGVFARSFLLELAKADGIARSEVELAYLTDHRYILTGNEGQDLLLSTVLRDHIGLIFRQQRRHAVTAWHDRAARYYEQNSQSLKTAQHWQRAGRWTQAATVLLRHSANLMDEEQVVTLRTLLAAFPSSKLEPEQWRDVQFFLCDLYMASGDTGATIAACRATLKASDTLADRHTLTAGLASCTRTGIPCMPWATTARRKSASPHTPPNSSCCSKNRGWLHILRRDWHTAATDLEQALALAKDAPVRADVLDALASLHRNQRQYSVAIGYAQMSLSLAKNSAISCASPSPWATSASSTAAREISSTPKPRTGKHWTSINAWAIASSPPQPGSTSAWPSTWPATASPLSTPTTPAWQSARKSICH